MQELRQSTQMIVRVGPATATDGTTMIDGASSPTLLLSTADKAELLKHNGATVVDISGATWASVPDTTTSPNSYVSGWFNLTLTTSHTDTLGQLTVVINDASLMMPIFRDFMVVDQNFWDSKYSTDYLQTDPREINGSAEAAQKLSAGTRALTMGTVQSSPVSTTSTIYTDIVGSGFPADAFNGRVMILYDNGTLGEQAARINDYSVAGSPERGVFTVSGFTNAPAASTTVVIA